MSLIDYAMTLTLKVKTIHNDSDSKLAYSSLVMTTLDYRRYNISYSTVPLILILA